MRFSWLQRVFDKIQGKKHVFVVKSSDTENLSELIRTVSSVVENSKVDVYTDCKDLFLQLNEHKNYYQIGVINENDKKNTANILSNMVELIDPNIKVITYSDKKSFQKNFSVI